MMVGSAVTSAAPVRPLWLAGPRSLSRPSGGKGRAGVLGWKRGVVCAESARHICGTDGLGIANMR